LGLIPIARSITSDDSVDLPGKALKNLGNGLVWWGVGGKPSNWWGSFITPERIDFQITGDWNLLGDVRMVPGPGMDGSLARAVGQRLARTGIHPLRGLSSSFLDQRLSDTSVGTGDLELTYLQCSYVLLY